jgi:hypothetical protein
VKLAPLHEGNIKLAFGDDFHQLRANGGSEGLEAGFIQGEE